MAIRKVIEAGHPRLKAKNQPIKKFNTPSLKKLVKDLKDTMYKADLIGIAAPQIAENYTVFITHPRRTKARRLLKEDILRIFINPGIVSQSKRKVMIYEGCGSVQGIFGPVTRPAELAVEAFDERGNKFSYTCDGILARVIQHEMDHLNGIEFIQKVDDYSKILNPEHYQKQVRNSKAQLQASNITKIEFKKL